MQAGHLLDDLLGLSPPTVRPRLDESWLVNIPGSVLFRHAQGIQRLIPAASRMREARAGIRRAVQRREVFHLHFHPWNFGWNRGPLMAALSRILETAAAERDAGRLEILPMGKVARRALAPQGRMQAWTDV